MSKHSPPAHPLVIRIGTARGRLRHGAAASPLAVSQVPRVAARARRARIAEAAGRGAEGMEQEREHRRAGRRLAQRGRCDGGPARGHGRHRRHPFDALTRAAPAFAATGLRFVLLAAAGRPRARAGVRVHPRRARPRDRIPHALRPEAHGEAERDWWDRRDDPRRPTSRGSDRCRRAGPRRGHRGRVPLRARPAAGRSPGVRSTGAGADLLPALRWRFRDGNACDHVGKASLNSVFQIARMQMQHDATISGNT